MIYSRFRSKVAGVFRRACTSRPKEKILAWAKRWIRLSSGESADFAGAYDEEINPLPTLLFDLYESGQYDEVIVKKSSQSGWTLIVFIFFAWWATFMRRNFMYVIDSEEEVEKISSERLQPLLKACKPVRGRIRTGAAAFTKVLLRFNGISGYLSGGKSLGKVSNKSVGLAVVDEVSALEKALSIAAVKANLKEIRARTKKQARSLFVNLSKVGPWEGIINQEYLTGTRHRCFVPCPHCTVLNDGIPAGYQVIEWEQIKFGHCKDANGGWDYERIEAETYFECLHCKGKIIEAEHKPWLIANRDWRQTNFGEDPEFMPEPRRASVENTDLYSTFPNLTWGRLAVKYAKSLGDPEELKNFFRDHLARADKPASVQTDESIIYKMTGGYKRGECPFLPCKVVMGVDKQKLEWKWVKTAFNFEGDAWVIDWGECINPAALLDVANEPVQIKHWPDHIPEVERVCPIVFKGLVDERALQKEVRDFLLTTLIRVTPDGTPDYRFHGCYGLARHTARSMKDIVSPGPLAKPNAIHNLYPLWSYAISTDNFNAEIHTHRFGKFKMILAARNEGKPVPPGIRRIWFPYNLDPAFVKEITRERYELDPKTRRWGWADMHGIQNDWGDALRMCFAAWYLLAPLEQAPPPVGAESLKDLQAGESSAAVVANN